MSQQMTTARKVYSILDHAQRKSAAYLLVLMLISMVVETAGTGMVIPAIVLLTEQDLAASYPQLQPWLHALGDPSRAQIITGGMLALVVINVIRAAFLAFMAWQQNKFAFGLQAELSERL